MLERELVEGVAITVFERPGCTDCVELEKTLIDNGIPHMSKNVVVDLQARKQATDICIGLLGKEELTLPILLFTQFISSEVNSVAAYIEPRSKAGLDSVAQALLAYCKPISQVKV
jgi:glutaredoxin